MRVGEGQIELLMFGCCLAKTARSRQQVLSYTDVAVNQAVVLSRYSRLYNKTRYSIMQVFDNEAISSCR